MYTNADLKLSLYVRVPKKQYSENFVFLTLRIIELSTRKVCEMFIYKHTETIEYNKK